MTRVLKAVVTLLLLSTLTHAGPPSPAEPEFVPVPDIRVALDLSKDAQDPQIHWTTPLAPMCFDPLYIWEPGESGPILKPCLATDWPTYSEDGLALTIKLREGAQFESPDGGKKVAQILPVTAHDVVFTLKRAAKYRHFNAYVTLEGLIVGLDAMPAATREHNLGWSTTDDEFSIEGLEAKDEHTLQVKLNRPNRLLPLLLAHPCFCVIKREFLKSYDMNQVHDDFMSWTSSPFSRTRREGLRFVWRVPPEPGCAPVNLREYSEVDYLADAVRKFDAGEIDYAYAMRNGSPKPLEPDPRRRILPLELMYYFAFNMKDKRWGALDDEGRTRRKAVASALRQGKLLEHWSVDSQNVTEPDALIPSRQGMAQLGSPDTWQAAGKDASLGLTIKIAIHDSFTKADQQDITDALKTVGVAADFLELDVAEMKKSIRECTADAWLLGWLNDSPDPSAFLSRLRTRGDGDVCDAGLFAGAYSSVEFDSAYARLEEVAPQELYADGRQTLIKQMFGLLERDCPYVPLIEFISYELIGEGIKAPELPFSAGSRFRHLRR